MGRDADVSKLNPEIGLCQICIHARTVENARGSIFYLCKLSETDSRFEKYPRLPVVSCTGFVPAIHASDTTSHDG
jgi:hypothetical protein